MYGPRINRNISRSIDNPLTPGKLMDELEDAGVKLPTKVKKARTTAAAAFDHIAQTTAQVQDDDAVQREAVTALADGTATPSQVLNAAISRVGTTSRQGHATTLHKIRRNADNETASRLMAEVHAVGEDWITKILRPVAEDLIAELRAADIPEMKIDKREHMHALEAVAKRPDVAAAWERLSTINRVADWLRVRGVIPSKLDDRDCYELMGPPDERGTKMHTFTVWTYFCRMGHTPGLYTQAEVDDYFAKDQIIRADSPEGRELQQRQMDIQRQQNRQFTSAHPGRL